MYSSTHGDIRQMVFSSQVLLLEEANNRKLIIGGLSVGPSQGELAILT